MYFWAKKVDGNMIFTDYWKDLVSTFSEMGNTVFSWAKNLTEIWYLLITGKFLFWTFWWKEIRCFFSQKVNGKMIFTWSFWAFYDIPVPGKYGFSRSVYIDKCILLIKSSFYNCPYHSWYNAKIFYIFSKSLLIRINLWTLVLIYESHIPSYKN